MQSFSYRKGVSVQLGTKSLYFCLLIIATFGSPALAQQYSYTQARSYIFDQVYVKTISQATAEEMLGESDMLRRYSEKIWQRERINQVNVTRIGARLVISFARRPPLSLKNYSSPGTLITEGDAQEFFYLGVVGQYHVIGVKFAHDSPGILLCDKDTAKIFFTHETLTP